MLNICIKIIKRAPEIGLPLGYYTSQWFANFYLQEFDHFIIEKLYSKYNIDTYVRYMDDIIILGNNKRKLINMYNEMNNYLQTNLNVWFKEETAVIHNIKNEPIDFIGYVFTYNKTTIRNCNFTHIKELNNFAKNHKFNKKTIQSITSLNGYIINSDSYTFKKNYLIPQRIISKNASKFNYILLRDTNIKEINHFINVIEKINKLKDIESTINSKVLVIYKDQIDEYRIVARSKLNNI